MSSFIEVLKTGQVHFLCFSHIAGKVVNPQVKLRRKDDILHRANNFAADVKYPPALLTCSMLFDAGSGVESRLAQENTDSIFCL